MITGLNSMGLAAYAYQNYLMGGNYLNSYTGTFADVVEKVIENLEAKEGTQKTEDTETDSTTSKTSRNQTLEEIIEQIQSESAQKKLLVNEESWWDTRLARSKELMAEQNQHYLKTAEQRKLQRKQAREEYKEAFRQRIYEQRI